MWVVTFSHKRLKPTKADLKRGVKLCPYSQKSYSINGIQDIEDIVKGAKEMGACPFLSARSALAKSNVVFAPYQYLLDFKIRNSMGLDLEGAYVLFDEAHNIPEVSRDVASLKINHNAVESLLKAVGRFVEMDKGNLEFEEVERVND